MSNIQKAKDYIGKAQDIRQGSAGFMRQLQEKAREEIKAIEQNRDLSDEGRARQSQAVRAKYGVDILQKTHTRRQEYLAHAARAHKMADETVFAALKKPDSTKLGRFENELRALKTEVMLSTRPESAMQKLTAFIGKLDDAYLANVVREQFADFAGPVIAVAAGDAAEYKMQLAQTFDKLKADFETDEVKEARQLMEIAQSLTDNPQLFSGFIVRDAVTESIGKEYADYLDNTDTYFAKNPEQKPAAYVHVLSDQDRLEEAILRQRAYDKKLEQESGEKWAAADRARRAEEAARKAAEAAAVTE